MGGRPPRRLQMPARGDLRGRPATDRERQGDAPRTRQKLDQRPEGTVSVLAARGAAFASGVASAAKFTSTWRTRSTSATVAATGFASSAQTQTKKPTMTPTRKLDMTARDLL